VQEGALELVLGDLLEPSGLELAKLGPRLRLDVGGDDARGLLGARKPAREHAVELDPAQHRRRGVRLVAPGDRQRHRLRPDRAPVLEVRDRRVAHQVEPAAAHS
jgi:hypothetical protein